MGAHPAATATATSSTAAHKAAFMSCTLRDLLRPWGAVYCVPPARPPARAPRLYTAAVRRVIRARDEGSATMGVEVVTIALTTGARAEQIGRLVAEHLGFRYVNDEIIDRAAEQAGVSRQAVAEVEQSPTLITRIMNSLAAGMAAEWSGRPLTGEEIDPSASYRRLIQAVIREVAAKRKAVILAHGASILLANSPGVLRVLVTASPSTRVARVATESGQDERQAKREIERA